MNNAPSKAHSAKPAPIVAGPGTARRIRRALLVAGAIGAGVVAWHSFEATQPAQAQLRPSDPGVQTPYGRAPLTFADIVDKVKGAVVSISVTNGEKTAEKSPGGRRFGGIPDVPDDHPLKDFFKNLPKEFSQPQRPSRPQLAQGSGFVISADGYVVTNNHVIDGASKIEVSFDDQEKLEAELVGTGGGCGGEREFRG